MTWIIRLCDFLSLDWISLPVTFLKQEPGIILISFSLLRHCLSNSLLKIKPRKIWVGWDLIYGEMQQLATKVDLGPLSYPSFLSFKLFMDWVFIQCEYCTLVHEKLFLPPREQAIYVSIVGHVVDFQSGQLIGHFPVITYRPVSQSSWSMLAGCLII